MSDAVFRFYARDWTPVRDWLAEKGQAVVRQQAHQVHGGQAWQATVVLGDETTATAFRAWLEGRDDVSFASPFDLFDRRRER